MLISLVGLPGSGKSTVGRHLARRLGVDFVDSDAVIERRLGETIRGFFEREGEDAFRDVEQEVIAELTSSTNAVLATGGGAVLRPANQEALRQRSTVVYLRATPEDLLRRVRRDTQRPLLQVDDLPSRLRQLHDQRDPLYRRIAHFTVETGRPSVPMLVNMVVMQLELSGVVPSPAVPPRGTRDEGS
jgi:shikimate kinase